MPFREYRHEGPEWYGKDSYEIVACDKCGKDIYAAQQYNTDVLVILCFDCYNQLPEKYIKKEG